MILLFASVSACVPSIPSFLKIALFCEETKPLKELFYAFVQTFMVLLQGKQIIHLLLHNLVGYPVRASHRLYRNDTPCQRQFLQYAWNRRNCGNFVSLAFLIGLYWFEYQPVSRRSGSDYVQHLPALALPLQDHIHHLAPAPSGAALLPQGRLGSLWFPVNSSAAAKLGVWYLVCQKNFLKPLEPLEILLTALYNLSMNLRKRHKAIGLLTV